MDGIAITIDIDWAPDPLIEDTREMLAEYDVPATFFATHDDGVSLDRHERAIHPNYFDEETQDDETVLASLLETYPDAAGVRSHGLYTHGRLQGLYPQYGIQYESNYLMYRQSSIRPFRMGYSVVQLPIYFMDDVWLRQDSAIPSPEDLLGGSGLRVFTFHPIHVFLNSPDIAYYEERKGQYHDVAKLRDSRHEGSGVRTLFDDLLKHVSDHHQEVQTLNTIAETYADEYDQAGVKHQRDIITNE